VTTLSCLHHPSRPFATEKGRQDEAGSVQSLKVEGADKQHYKPRPLFCKAEMLLKHKSANHFNLVRQK
jgi:hypothetical protein